MIKQIFIGLFTGFILTLMLASYDPWVQDSLGEASMRLMAQAFSCDVSGTVKHVNFIIPEIVIEDLRFTQSHGDATHHNAWHWRAQEYRAGFSWLHLCLYGFVDLWIVAQGMQFDSTIVDGELSITGHIQDMLKPADLPIPLVIKQVSIQKASLLAHNDRIDLVFNWNSESQRFDTQFRTTFIVTNASIAIEGNRVIHNTSGNIIFDGFDANVPYYNMRVDCKADLDRLAEYKTVFIGGTWLKKNGRFSISSIDQSLVVNPIIITQDKEAYRFEVHARAPFDYCTQSIASYKSAINGTCHAHISGTFDTQLKCDGRVMIENAILPSFSKPSRTGPSPMTSSPMPSSQMVSSQIGPSSMGSSSMGSSAMRSSSMRLSIHKRDDEWYGSIYGSLYSAYACKGSWKWDQVTELGYMNFHNTTEVSIPYLKYWNMKPQDFVYESTWDRDAITSSHAAIVSNKFLDTMITSSGKTVYDKHTRKIIGEGAIHDRSYELSADTTYPYINKAVYKNNEKQTLLELERHQDDSVLLHVDYNIVRSIAYNVWGYDLQGAGRLSITSTLRDSVLLSDIILKDANIRLPETYNFINGFTGKVTCDFTKRRCSIDDMKCSLHTGSLRLTHGMITWNERGISYVHVPLLLDKCLLNIRQDLFTSVSGALDITAKDVLSPLVKGSLILDRSQLKENIFALALQKRLFSFSDSMKLIGGFTPKLDISVETKEPIRIDTDFLRANAAVGLRIGNTMQDPIVDGAITLNAGTLNFPYKSLTITRGILTFLPEQRLNPLLELIARNTIKKHNIGLQVTGTLSDNTILLESTPPLTDEQIVALLLTGSSEESLSAVVPSLLVQNITNLIFSSNQSRVLERYVRPWMKQFNIHFTPILTDKSGRGGLRGGIEIEVNDRWRALIEKNLTLTEDTRFELEYILSDEVTFRMLRDERCDIGGEVEMKWKF